MASFQAGGKTPVFHERLEDFKQFRFGGGPNMLNHFVGDSIFAWGFLVPESSDGILEFRRGEV